ncbi:MAG: NAD(P)-dependent dehydrogenase (short-subunit alcohol dehydrogenase family) [Gammaproteobacteria bacterium]|jgi:NAD(P)-dependent dehydrogenase (short-subunit alcohol dehydrogenase family)
MATTKKIALITGTSTGIGLAASVHFARKGYRVFAGMRNTAKSGPLTEAGAGLPIEVLQLDITNDASVDAAVALALKAGPIDVLVNNAGVGGATPLELTPMDEHKAMFETNYFGTIRCIQAVLPKMRERGSGCIVNNTSMEGLFAMPNQIAYSASKWALECAGEALAHEVARFGIRVVNIEPGVIMTQIFENSAPATRYDKHSPYQSIMRRNGKMFSAGFRVAVPPERVAETMLEAVETPDYRLRWLVGEDANGMVKGRKRMSDEEFVHMGTLDEDEYNAAYKAHFGVEL